MMALRTLIVGLGRSGAGLHLPALTRARASQPAGLPFDSRPFITFDTRIGMEPLLGTVRTGSLAAAAAMTDPASTVVHLCTPPTVRAEVLTELARHGFRKILIEKPMASDERSLDQIEGLRRHHDLELAVVTQWLVSTLTARIKRVLREGQYGSLRSIRMVQRKPRFSRSQATDGHPTAFDVEMPHSVGVALDIAGDAQVRDAGWADMTFGDVIIPRLGEAWLELDHAAGVRTVIHSDLTAPDRERRITVELDGATLTGHYPSSGADDYSQLKISTGGHDVREIFPDEALSTFMAMCYQRFAGTVPGALDADLARSAEVVRLISAAKRICAGESACLPARV
jgi:predicted dehydrogenase